jgi:hypothetical protein
MLIFGGENDTGQLDELLELNLDTRAWRTIPTTPTLSARTDLASAVDTVRNRLVIVGGRMGLARSIDEVWALDLSTYTWQRLPSGPPARHDVPAASDGAHAWVFGGAGEFLQSLQDLWQLDFATDVWTQLPAGGESPPARGSSALAYWGGALYLVGGHDASMVKRDAWRYDLELQRWTRLAPSGSPPAWAHFGYAVDPSCGRFILVAGDNLDNQDTSLATTYTLATTTSFANLAASSLPPPRDHPSLVVDPVRREAILFGGGTLGDGLGTLSDAWIFPLQACR